MVSTDVASGRVMMSVCRRQTRVLFGCFCQRRSTQPQPQVSQGSDNEEHISRSIYITAHDQELQGQGARGHVVHQGQGGGREAPHPEQGQGGPASAGMRSRPARDRLGLAGLWAERVSCERLRRAGEYKSFIDSRFLPCVDPSFFLSAFFLAVRFLSPAKGGLPRVQLALEPQGNR